MRDRETLQLLLASHHYASMAERLVKKDYAVLNLTIRQITATHSLKRLRREELILAHIASASMRLCSICEKYGTTLFPKPYRNEFYEHGKRKTGVTKDDVIRKLSSNLDQHIHYLLRDNAGHKERDKDIGEDRFELLEPLTVGRILSSFKSAHIEIHNKIKDVI